jgi:putative oxidoreductase
MLQSGKKAAESVAPIAALVTRLVYGHQFMVTGWGKWQNLDGPTSLFASNGIPFPYANAVLVAIVELVGGACLILGLGTRLCAALLSATMVVALITVHRSEFKASVTTWSADPTDIAPVVFLAALLWLVGYGGGPVSVDARIARNLNKEGS